MTSVESAVPVQSNDKREIELQKTPRSYKLLVSTIAGFLEFLGRHTGIEPVTPGITILGKSY